MASSVKGAPGREGYFEFFFDTEKPKPKINKDGTVDYRSMSLVQNVTEGSLLAVYHPAVQGTSGRDVTGAFEKVNIKRSVPLRERESATKKIRTNIMLPCRERLSTMGITGFPWLRFTRFMVTVIIPATRLWSLTVMLSYTELLRQV